jgi:hypothetical protein
MIWMSQSSVRRYNAAAHVIRLDTRINIVQPMMLAAVLLKLALQVMLQMEDLRLHQGVGDVADRVLVRCLLIYNICRVEIVSDLDAYL